MNKTVTKTAEIYLDEDGILHINVINGAHIEIEDAADNFLVTKSLCKGKPVLKLVDARSRWTLTKEAREFIKRENTASRNIARALLFDSSFTVLMNNIAFSLFPKGFPQKAFRNENKAIQWLKSHIF